MLSNEDQSIAAMGQRQRYRRMKDSKASDSGTQVQELLLLCRTGHSKRTRSVSAEKQIRVMNLPDPTLGDYCLRH